MTIIRISDSMAVIEGILERVASHIFPKLDAVEECEITMLSVIQVGK